jgi:hypothetical protein
MMITNRDAGNFGTVFFDQVNTTTIRYQNGGNLLSASTPATTTGFFGCSRVNTSQVILKIPGSASSATADAPPGETSAANYQALAAGLRNTSYSRHRGGVIYVGNAINQDTFNTAVTTFMSTISSISF